MRRLWQEKDMVSFTCFCGRCWYPCVRPPQVVCAHVMYVRVNANANWTQLKTRGMRGKTHDVTQYTI